MFFHKKKRWICEEVQTCLLSLPPVYDILVKKDYGSTVLRLPFRDDEGKILVDPYESNIVGIEIDYMKNGFWIETIYVGKKGIETQDAAYIKSRIEKYVARFPITHGTANLKQLGEMREKLRSVIFDSMGINFVRKEWDNSPSIHINFTALSPEQKMQVFDVISELDGETVGVSVNIGILGCDEERMYATLDRLALIDLQKENENEG